MTQLMRGAISPTSRSPRSWKTAPTCSPPGRQDAFGALKISHRSEFNNRYSTNAAFADANRRRSRTPAARTAGRRAHSRRRLRCRARLSQRLVPAPRRAGAAEHPVRGCPRATGSTCSACGARSRTWRPPTRWRAVVRAIDPGRPSGAIPTSASSTGPGSRILQPLHNPVTLAYRVSQIVLSSRQTDRTMRRDSAQSSITARVA